MTVVLEMKIWRCPNLVFTVYQILEICCIVFK